MDIPGLISFFKDHWQDVWNILQTIFAALGVIYVALLSLVKLTPTPKDDEFLEGIGNFFNGFKDFIHRVAGAFGVKK